MTIFNIQGFFQLKFGRCVPTVKGPALYTVWHLHYNTHVWCTDDTSIAAELRLYGSNSTPTLPDGTVVFAFCKAHATPNRVISVDSVTFIPIPGDPVFRSDHLPEERTSFVVAIGHATGPAETLNLNDGHSSRAFPISVNDYVANGTVSSTIQPILILTCSSSI
ncbi:hypothetical protein B0H14DRAFT_2356900 [Mycena olivaceomarginata]|nr:hypothetical protein B0H14DRAFT_2356900 [Mycena olivaceomarginata]